MEIKRLKSPGLTKFLYFFAKFAFASMASCELYYFAGFLTESAKISVGIVALIMTVTSIIDTIATFLNGFILEKVRMPWGKCRSWMLVGPPIFVILTLLMFSRVSDNEMVSAVVIILGFVLGHIIWTVTESAYAALSVVITDDMSERTALSINSGRGSMGSGLVFGVISVALIGVFGKFTTNPYFFLVLVFGAFCCLGYWLLFAVTSGCEETRASAEAAAKPRDKGPSTVAMLKGVANRNIITQIITGAFGQCSMFLTSAVAMYFFMYNLESFQFMGIFMTVRSIGALAGSLVTPILLKIFKGRKKHVIMFGSIVAAGHNIILWLIHPSFMVYAVVSIVATIFASSGTMLGMAMWNDCSVQAEYKTGQDVKGFIMSLLNIPLKLSLLARSAIVGAVLASVNYTAGAEVTPAILNAFSNAYLLYPAIMGIVSLIILTVGYNLKEADVAKMLEEIKARKAEGAPEQ